VSSDEKNNSDFQASFPKNPFVVRCVVAQNLLDVQAAVLALVVQQ